jgi:ABC-2 type transport system ATP-binding protein
MSTHYDRLQVRNLEIKLGSFHLSDVSFDLRLGEVVGYLGHNGSGKTSTFRAMADLVRPVGGHIRFGGLDHRRNEREFRERVSFIGENHRIYPRMKVGEALALARSLHPRWDQTWCDRMCSELRLPTDTKITHLSAGMRTKLGLILGFSPRPLFAILDEPTSALDVASSGWVWDTVRTQVKTGQLGVLVSSHSLDEVMTVCDRFIVLENGRISHQFAITDNECQALDYLKRSLGWDGTPREKN